MDGRPEEEEVEYLGDDVAGGEGEDVGAGDLVGALGVGVDGGLGAGDEVQRVR